MAIRRLVTAAMPSSLMMRRTASISFRQDLHGTGMGVSLVQPCAEVIQRLVDSPAARIRRSVAVDDERGSLIVCSRHYGDEDRLRVDVVLSRRLPATAAAYLDGFGIATSATPGRFPPTRLSGSRNGAAGDCVVQLTARLRGRSLRVSEEERRLRVLAADLLNGGGSAHAAADLVDQGLVGAEDEVAVIVAGRTRTRRWSPP